jgi:DNA uptake protein ComE-like DNA-binding protein
MATGEKQYQLKHPETSFFDDQTNFTVTRDEVVTIGPGAGKKTMQMIQKGGLIEVNTKPKAPTGSGPVSTEGGDVLAADFPGKKALEAAGHTTLASVNALSADALKKVKGLSQKDEEAILAMREG